MGTGRLTGSSERTRATSVAQRTPVGIGILVLAGVTAALCASMSARAAPLSAASQSTPKAAPPSRTSAAQTSPTQPPSRPTPSSTTAEGGQEPLRLRIGVTAIQIDAVVTDKNGKRVPDLREKDFEIFQDGVKQTVVSAQYVPLDPVPARTNVDAGEVTARMARTAPPPQPRRDEVRRTMAIIVDDLNLSFESSNSVRSALQQFITRDMQDGDLVAILRTGRGVGRFQPFTTDKRILLRNAASLRYNMLFTLRSPLEEPDEITGDAFDAIQGSQQDTITAGSLLAVSTVVRGMRDMPGRKAVLLVSDGWSKFFLSSALGGSQAMNDPAAMGQTDPFAMRQSRIAEATRQLVDEANRSFVVLHTLDARGVQAPSLRTDESGPPSIDEMNAERFAEFLSHGGPSELAALGGGQYFRGRNDLAGQMGRAMADQRGYYLIGYQPADETFKRDEDRTRFHRLKVRVTRPGLKVRTRTGFFGVTDEEMSRPAPATREQRLLRAIDQPLTATDVGLEATGLFWRHPTRGPMVRALLQVDARGLSFSLDEQGRTSAPVELAAALVDERGAMVGYRATTVLVSAKGATPDDRFVSAIDLPVREGGAYQLRAAARDMRSSRLGAASEFVIVPGAKDSRLALSGVMLAGGPLSNLVPTEIGLDEGAAGQGSPNQVVEPALAHPASLNPAHPDAADPNRRRFEAGMAVDYTFQVYNAERNRDTGRPALSSSFRLFREGQLVKDGALSPETIDAPGDTLAERKTALSAGRLTLGDDLAPGTYDLEVAVTDTLGKKDRPAVQWTSFTVSPR